VIFYNLRGYIYKKKQGKNSVADFADFVADIVA